MVAPSAPRDARSKIPPGPEGSNGIGRCGRRGQPAGPSPFQVRFVTVFAPRSGHSLSSAVAMASLPTTRPDREARPVGGAIAISGSLVTVLVLSEAIHCHLPLRRPHCRRHGHTARRGQPAGPSPFQVRFVTVFAPRSGHSLSPAVATASLPTRLYREARAIAISANCSGARKFYSISPSASGSRPLTQ